MNNTSKKTLCFSFDTKFSPEKVISTAVRFFSSRNYPRNYNVQSQGSNWITFEPGYKKNRTAEQIICLIASIFWFSIGGFLIGRGYNILNSFLGSAYHFRASFMIGFGIFCILLGIAAIVRVWWLSELSKLPQNITITTETLSGKTQVTIEHPSQKKVKILVEDLISVLDSLPGSTRIRTQPEGAGDAQERA
jgi:hypothetical protein